MNLVNFTFELVSCKSLVEVDRLVSSFLSVVAGVLEAVVVEVEVVEEEGRLEGAEEAAETGTFLKK